MWRNLRNPAMQSAVTPNWSAHMDTQQKVAAARPMLRASGLQRYTYRSFHAL